MAVFVWKRDFTGSRSNALHGANTWLRRHVVQLVSAFQRAEIGKEPGSGLVLFRMRQFLGGCSMALDASLEPYLFVYKLLHSIGNISLCAKSCEHLGGHDVQSM